MRAEVLANFQSARACSATGGTRRRNETQEPIGAARFNECHASKADGEHRRQRVRRGSRDKRRCAGRSTAAPAGSPPPVSAVACDGVFPSDCLPLNSRKLEDSGLPLAAAGLPSAWWS